MKQSELPENLLPWRKEFEIKTDRLLRIVGRYLTEEELAEVKRACVYGAFAHEEQFRSSGEPYIFHPIAVALILSEVQIDKDSLVGAILHDVIEDTEITYEEIENEFGTEVAQIVDGVTKLTQIKFRSKEEAKAENFRKMVLAMTKDLRVIMVKLADRLHNMRTLGALPAYKKRRIANETLDIYAPIAARLGMYALQVHLENLCFENIYPLRYATLSKAIEEKYARESENLNRIKNAIDERLVRSNILSRISTRRKHLWSIYNKLKIKGKIELVYDIFAIRIIVPTVDECYRALGMVHQLYKPIMGGFKDYIAIPKGNGYQSLHTIVFGSNGLPVEVQIRTRDMHVIAEAGAAAHWRYKDAYEGQEHTQMRTNQWLDTVTELQDSGLSSQEFMETMKADLFPKEIYLFTPKGKIIELPRGSTGIDFAYAVHTEVGNTCHRVFVDGVEVELSQPLRNGQTIRIETKKGSAPSSQWLNYVVSARARTSILAYLSRLTDEEAYTAGRELLNEALDRKGLLFKNLTEEEEQAMLEELELGSKEQLFIAVGRGKYPTQYVINRFLVKQKYPHLPQPELVHEEGSEVSSDVIIGAQGMKTSLGRCCYPLPGEPIIGYLSQRHGMVIHLVDCANVENYKKQPERWIPLAWSKKARGEFPVQLFLIAKNRRGAIASVSAKVTELNLDFEELTSEPINEDLVRIIFVTRVQDRKHLADIMRELRLLKAVERVSRR